MNKNTFGIYRYIVTFLSVLFFIASKAQSIPLRDSIEQKIKVLLQQMNFDEKVGQMNQYNGFWEIPCPVPKEGNAKIKYGHQRRGSVGAVLNVKGTEKVRILQAIAVDEIRPWLCNKSSSV